MAPVFDRQPERFRGARLHARQHLCPGRPAGWEYVAGRVDAGVGTMKALVIILLVVGALIGGLLTLRSSRSSGMPGPDVLERAKRREREQTAKDEQDPKP